PSSRARMTPTVTPTIPNVAPAIRATSCPLLIVAPLFFNPYRRYYFATDSRTCVVNVFGVWRAGCPTRHASHGEPYSSRRMPHAIYGEPFTQVAVCPTSVLYNIIDDGCIPFKTYSVTDMSQYFSGALLLISTHSRRLNL